MSSGDPVERDDGAPLRIGVIGPGAIGTSVAAELHLVGRTPMLFGRTPRESLVLHKNDDIVVVPGPVLIEPTNQGDPLDLVLLAVKATQVDAAGPWLQAVCDERTVVCVLQNGVEQLAVAAHVPRDEFCRRSCGFRRLLVQTGRFVSKARPG